MSITYILIALLALGNTFYAYRCIIGTRGFIDQYGTGDGSAFPIKMVGSFCAGMAFMLVYALLTDLGGKWELFTFGFVQAALLTVLGYQSKGVKVSATSYWYVIMDKITCPDIQF